MPAGDGRIDQIGAAILSQAEQEARELIDKANATKERELKAFEAGLIDGMFGRVQQRAAQIRRRSVKAAAKEQLEAHRSLLTHRAEKTAMLFYAVAARLKAYAKTEEYRAAALKTAEKHKARRGEDNTVYVAEADLALGGELARILGGGAMAADDILLGGFRLLCPDSGVLIDETLDERLNEQRRPFMERCGLKVM